MEGHCVVQGMQSVGHHVVGGRHDLQRLCCGRCAVLGRLPLVPGVTDGLGFFDCFCWEGQNNQQGSREHQEPAETGNGWVAVHGDVPVGGQAQGTRGIRCGAVPVGSFRPGIGW